MVALPLQSAAKWLSEFAIELTDGRFVSTTPLTLSIVQCSRPDAMKRDNSLCDLCEHVCKRWKVSDTPVDKVDAHAERSYETVESMRLRSG